MRSSTGMFHHSFESVSRPSISAFFPTVVQSVREDALYEVVEVPAAGFGIQELDHNKFLSAWTRSSFERQRSGSIAVTSFVGSVRFDLLRTVAMLVFSLVWVIDHSCKSTSVVPQCGVTHSEVVPPFANEQGADRRLFRQCVKQQLTVRSTRTKLKPLVSVKSACPAVASSTLQAEQWFACPVSKHINIVYISAIFLLFPSVLYFWWY